MSDVVAGLEPRSVWGHFSSITQIPRPSKHEERMAAWVRGLAEQRGWEVLSDAVGNLVVRVPATAGREQAPTVIIQGHLDMVCEKNKDVEHDFTTDPIRAAVDGEWVVAEGTTLGSDNGIGVAAALAAATDETVKHGPLELLFTLDEETGLTGAQQLDASILTGRTLLNLDSEEDGVLFVGCAGGSDTHLLVSVARDGVPTGASHYLLEVTGLRGGHSGLNINENRGNAIKILAHILYAASAAGVDLGLATLQGGSMHNAIPREAEAGLWLDDGARAALERVIESRRQALKTELAGIDEGVELSLKPGGGQQDPLRAEDAMRLVRLLVVLPHGVLGMSPAIPGLVETSNNLAVVIDEGPRFKIVCSSRSSVAPTMDVVLASLRAAGETVGAEVEVQDGYPGWKPDLDSPVLQVVREVYAELWERDPEVTAIHAGLECGLLGEKVPGLDMVSFGPQIEGAHSPQERVHVPSVARFWEALKRTLDRLSAAA